jgi:type VI secretion system protein ImpK
MTPQFSELVLPVFSYALNLKERMDNGEEPDLESEQRQLIERLRSDTEVRRQTDYAGDGGNFLGARYALTCWIDELFIVYSPWAEQWKEKILELALYGTRDRAWKFWEQTEIALRRPRTPSVTVPPGPDALEAIYLCVALGFRGRYLENPGRVKEFMDELRPQVSRSTNWAGPRDLGVTTNAEPLLGRATLGRVVGVMGGISLLLFLVLLIVLVALGHLGS